MTICERMFRLLEAKKPKLTPAELSRMLGLSSGQMTTWKQRNTDPPARYIIQICEYLDVTPYYLLTGESGPVPKDELSQLTDDERRVLSKYRSLDEDGMDAVRGVLLDEQRRVESERGVADNAAG